MIKDKIGKAVCKKGFCHPAITIDFCWTLNVRITRIASSMNVVTISTFATA